MASLFRSVVHYATVAAGTVTGLVARKRKRDDDEAPAPAASPAAAPAAAVAALAPFGSLVSVAAPTVAAIADPAPVAAQPVSTFVGGRPLRQRLGETPPPRAFKPRLRTVRVLIVGETGAGKSTFLNVCYSMMSGLGPDNLQAVVSNRYFGRAPGLGACHERSVQNVGASQTDAASTYRIDDLDLGVRWEFIDTPGLLDTRGTAQDDANLSAILSYVSSLPSLHAVLLVVNGRVTRVTADKLYAAQKLRYLLPDVLLDNLCVVVSNAASENVGRDGLSRVQPPPPPGHAFYLDNSAFATDPASRTDDDREQVKSDWRRGAKELKRLRDKLVTLGALAVTAFKEMAVKRQQIKTELARVMAEFSSLQAVIEAMEAHSARAVGAASDREEYKNFTQQRVERQKQLQDAPDDQHSTMCLACQTMCHQPCGLNEFEGDVDDDDEDRRIARGKYFSNCYCFLHGDHKTCRVCGCDTMSHFHAKKVYVEVEVTVEAVVEELRAKYENAGAQLKDAERGRSTAKGDLALVKRAQSAKLDAIRDLCREVKTICSGFNFVDELQSVVAAMDMSAQQLKNVKARNEANATIATMTAFIEALSRGDGAAGGASGSGAGAKRGAAAGKSPSGVKVEAASPASPAVARPRAKRT